MRSRDVWYYFSVSQPSPPTRLTTRLRRINQAAYPCRSISPHLKAYLDEQTFRYNERHLNDGQRFNTVIGEIVGKRLTYKQLTANQLSF